MTAGAGGLRTGPGGHAVLFYSGVDEFTGQVGEFLLEGIRAGGSYPADSVRGDRHQDALAEVCGAHASVAGDVPGRA